jgi:DNA mismatch repair protein MutS
MAGQSKTGKMKARKVTPLMEQYGRIKQTHPEALLLFRVGDFYETFGEDAITTARVLNIVLTKRGNGSASEIELAGFPHHSLQNYLPKLVKAGLRVAVCDQLEDPKTTKTIVKRGVTELVTPGVAIDDQVLNASENNWLAAVCTSTSGRGKSRMKLAGVAFLDVSTGEFLAAQGRVSEISVLLKSFGPKETLHERHKEHADLGLEGYQFPLDDWVFAEAYAIEKISDHFGARGVKGFGLEGQPLAVIAAGAALHYLGTTRDKKLAHISSLGRIELGEAVGMDGFTVRNLELLHPTHPDGTSLADVMDRSRTPMGARMLRRWIGRPLCDMAQVTRRHEAITAFSSQSELRADLAARLGEMGDLERLLGKVAADRISPAGLAQLRRALESVEGLRLVVDSSHDEVIGRWAGKLDPCDEMLQGLRDELVDEPPAVAGKGEIIRDGRNAELDDVRDLLRNGKTKLLEIQRREAESTGISSLKIAFNNVFGYYLEVRHAHKDKVPESWTRKQTLTQAERYITPELKDLEQRILDAEQRVDALELRLFKELIHSIHPHLPILQSTARAVAGLDVLVGFSELAEDLGYTRPQLDESTDLEIIGGRHPVIERCLPQGESYVANDVFLDQTRQQILMITGPNMSGKSALLRQTALIALMAQVGSFVPARSVRMGMVDKIFTRVGASDNMSQGESTFMVEMNETASILHNLSDRSLVLLDEIGRGTSTYDGISIAWAIAEFLHDHPTCKAKTLFATHYHELNRMADRFERIQNANVSVAEVDGSILFLRKLEPGGCEHSFGIHVAVLAGMPAALIRRAEEVLLQLESAAGKADNSKEKTYPVSSKNAPELAEDGAMQLSFFQLDDPVLQDIKDTLLATDIDQLTPLEALIKLHEIKKRVGG